MTNIYLHGELRNLYGEHFKLNIESAKDTFRAINSNRKGFITTIKKLMGKGVYYRIIIDDEVLQDPKELEIQRVPQEIHIVPIVWGAGNNQGLQMILLAAVIVAVSLANPVVGAIGAKGVMALQMTAAALAVQGVMTLL